jgi:hypothetical protein
LNTLSEMRIVTSAIAALRFQAASSTFQWNSLFH